MSFQIHTIFYSYVQVCVYIRYAGIGCCVGAPFNDVPSIHAYGPIMYVLAGVDGDCYHTTMSQ